MADAQLVENMLQEYRIFCSQPREEEYYAKVVSHLPKNSFHIAFEY